MDDSGPENRGSENWLELALILGAVVLFVVFFTWYLGFSGMTA